MEERPDDGQLGGRVIKRTAEDSLTLRDAIEAIHVGERIRRRPILVVLLAVLIVIAPIGQATIGGGLVVPAQVVLGIILNALATWVGYQAIWRERFRIRL